MQAAHSGPAGGYRGVHRLHNRPPSAAAMARAYSHPAFVTGELTDFLVRPAVTCPISPDGPSGTGRAVAYRVHSGFGDQSVALCGRTRALSDTALTIGGVCALGASRIGYREDQRQAARWVTAANAWTGTSSRADVLDLSGRCSRRYPPVVALRHVCGHDSGQPWRSPLCWQPDLPNVPERLLLL